MEVNRIYNEDCLDVLRRLDDESVDAIITDPPYGNTGMKWDLSINVDQMWQELKRIVKPRRAIVLFCGQPFTSRLIVSNPKWFKYCWVWQKSNGAGFLNAKNAPIQYHEDIAVFSSGTTANGSPEHRMTYFPQGLTPYSRVRKNTHGGVIGYRPSRTSDYTQDFENYPTTILKFANDRDKFHPTQKPVDLMRYLVRTYTSEGETVLDFTMGSGSTGVACVLEGRQFIGIEREREYFATAEQRIKEASGARVESSSVHLMQENLFT